MKISINHSQIFETRLTLEEIAENISKGVIDVSLSGNIINWKRVWSVIVMEEKK